MRKLASILVLVWLLCALADAQKLRWPEMRNQELKTFDWNCAQTKRFPKRELGKIVRKAIPSEDQGQLGTWGDRAYKIELTDKAQSVYFVPTVCGATGSCTWRLYSIDPVKYLGTIDGEAIYTYQSSNGWPTIITYTHMSAAEGILSTYRLHNDKYRWLGDNYAVDYQGLSGNRMPKFLAKAKKMCKDFGG